MRRRLDTELVRRGLVRTRSAAADAIRAGAVVVQGNPASKAGTLVAPDESVALIAASRRFVSRGGEKLDAALERFAIDVAERLALDAGASTGGFTDVLLRRGARHVIAVDVGYGQLDWSLRGDERVTVMERTNVRSLRPDSLAYRPELVVVDVSFISLRAVLPALADVAAVTADFVLLVKPQFEAGRQDVGSGGVVRDPDVWARALHAVGDACTAVGLSPRAAMASPVTGPAGNVEFLLHANRPASSATGEPDMASAFARAIADGTRLRTSRA
jgi:23S rRNA (cytidine1920-2'-O)/16S rRNA (cytidine1409-2'-O)-methyltransferase